MSEQHKDPINAAAKAARASAYADGFKQGASSERARVKTIIGSEAAKDRGGLALSLACGTDMPPDQVERVLLSTPKGYH